MSSNSGTVDHRFWKGKNVFSQDIQDLKEAGLAFGYKMGAKVTGYSVSTPTNPSLYKLGSLEEIITDSIIGDVSDLEKLRQSIKGRIRI